MLDANEILPGLWVGAMPRRGAHVARAGFTHLVACAKELQPEPGDYPGIAYVKAPMDDADLTGAELSRANAAAQIVAELLKRGGRTRVFVACAQGRNRSAFVAALAVRQLRCMTGAGAANFVRERRQSKHGPVLVNPSFVSLLFSLPRKAACR